MPSTNPRILAFAGSARRDSWNATLLRAAVAASGDVAASITVVPIAEYAMPLYDGDSEATTGLPEGAVRLKKLLRDHDAVLLACPEYNSAITPLLKNVIDWTSRPGTGEQPLECWKGKVAGLLAASPGALGGLRGLVGVRAILGSIGVLVVPEQAAIAKVHEAFDAQGSFKDPKQAAQTVAVVAAVARVAGALARS